MMVETAMVFELGSEYFKPVGESGAAGFLLTPALSGTRLFARPTTNGSGSGRFVGICA